MQAYTEEQRKALAAEIVEQLVDCGSADDVAIERYNAWVFKRLRTIAPPVVAPAEPDGWKLVPVNAFPSQWAAGQKAFDSAGMNKVDAVYKAMVAAAPEVE